jgi:polyphosphate kinase
MATEFFNRDISWLSFNQRVLMEASKPAVPLVERIRFLSIYSSNLDEFYRVRMPVLMALGKIENGPMNDLHYFEHAQQAIHKQQEFFGQLLREELIPQLKQQQIHLVYNEPLPESIREVTKQYFFNTIAAFIEVIDLDDIKDSFFENNKLYIVVQMKEGTSIINIPSNNIPRFFCTQVDNIQYVLFIDDIIKQQLPSIFAHASIEGAYSIKVTRDAELDLQDEFEGDIAEKIELQITKRDLGLATRFLYQPNMPLPLLESIVDTFHLKHGNIMAGGNYHNLKDFAAFPISNAALQYAKQTPIAIKLKKDALFEEMKQRDILVHPPYQSYDPILRFFNEAAINKEVEEIYTTMYRVASDSRIVHALITAAKNGKKVTAFVELKARFDEANNIKWAKVMKAAGVKIIYSIPQLKVHAKVALAKKREAGRLCYYGLLATGNLNESTAKFYTDHILLTSNGQMLSELEMLFIFLSKRRKPKESDYINFKHLLVAQFNLQQQFIALIEREIANAKNGLPANITIKLNNLEEEVLINKLYEASNAGVKINLIVRSICRIIPGIKGMSENITTKRIVDRYLEHGRIFIFHNNSNEQIFLGSSDWMNRNIYRRIEVCFPLYNEALKQEIKSIIALQWKDNVAAVLIDENLNNKPIEAVGEKVQSQQAIYGYLGFLYKSASTSSA